MMGKGGRGTGGKSGGGGFGLVILLLAIGLIAWVGSSGWYMVQPSEQGVVLRFGKYHRITGNGFHLKLPSPIETVIKPAIEQTRSITIPSAGASDYENTLMLTGDQNIVSLVFTIQWRIGTDEEAIRDYLFEIEDAASTVRSVGESAMREVIGQTDLQPILQNDSSITDDVQLILQDTLDAYSAGVDVTSVDVEAPTLPRDQVPVEDLDEFGRPVITDTGQRRLVAVSPNEAYLDVRNSQSRAARAVEDANAYANRVVPDARGVAARIIASAKADADAVVREARGEVAKFTAIYQQYRANPEVVRAQLHRETLEQILARSDVIILDNEGGDGAVPYLPLNELVRRDTQANQ